MENLSFKYKSLFVLLFLLFTALLFVLFYRAAQNDIFYRLYPPNNVDRNLNL